MTIIFNAVKTPEELAAITPKRIDLKRDILNSVISAGYGAGKKLFKNLVVFLSSMPFLWIAEEPEEPEATTLTESISFIRDFFRALL